MSRHHAGLPTGFVILKGYVIARGDLATALGSCSTRVWSPW
jgi:hypothetical protein